jgi:uncharacterized protein (DUF885 family)
MKRILLGLLAGVGIAAAVFLVPTIWLRPWSVDHFYARVFIQFALRHPMLLTSMGFLENTPFRGYADELDDLSVASARAEAEFVERSLRTLRAYDRSRMSPVSRRSAEVMDWFLEDQRRGSAFLFHDYPVNQLAGIQSGLPDFMLTIQPLRRERDARAYVARVEKFPRAFDQTIEGLRLRDSLGVVPPRFVLARVLAEMEGFVARPVEETPLYTHFDARLDSVSGLTPAERERLRARLFGAIESRVVPAYRRLMAEVERLRARATDDDGVWKLPGGDAYYAWTLRHHTTSDLPADTLHALGLAEVERLEAEMRPLLAALGHRGKTIGEAVDRMRRDPRFAFPPGDEGRQRILERYREILADAERRCEALFDVRPKAGLAIERVPPFKERTSPGAYYNAGTLDGSRPGVFFVNLRDPGETRRPDMRTLAYHEGVPGHHFQIAIAQELRGVPFFRRVIPFTAYAEGWGLYAERLALEHGFHQDAEDSLGALQAELFRAVRLVVDTGIHRRRWTRQRAIDYMVEHTGTDTASVVTEVERYIVLPGQACAYKVGQLEILRLRQRAIDRLGSRFDLRRFHDVVLTGGAVPLALLERAVDDWIAAERAATRPHARGPARARRPA